MAGWLAGYGEERRAEERGAVRCSDEIGWDFVDSLYLIALFVLFVSRIILNA